jgi:flagellar export protein FliJ
MKFRFRYQQILRFRKSLEDVAFVDYAEAAKKTKDAERVLADLAKSISAAHRQAMEIRRLGGSTASELMALDSFITGQGFRLEQKKLELRQLKSEEEEFQETLRARATDRKSLDILNDKQKTEWKKEMRKKDTKASDEMVVMSFPRREKK